jgi:hypothetical protein
MAVSTIMITAGPAGALANECIEHMDPNGQGNASGLTVACTFLSGIAAGTNFTMEDAYSPLSPQPGGAGNLGVASGVLWHYGAARTVNVTATRNTATTFTPASNRNLKSCATNNTAAAVSTPAGGLCPAPGAAPANLQFSQADVNRSVEYAPSTIYHGDKTALTANDLSAVFIAAGSFITCVGASCVPALPAGVAKLSKPLVNTYPLPNNAPAPPACPAAAASCVSTNSAPVLVSHGTNRAVTDGTTSAGTGTVTSATAHFCGAPGATTGNCVGISDVGARVSGGDLPDGATISAVNSQTSVTLICTACTGGFAGVSTASAQPISIDPKTPNTTTRYATDVTAGGASGRTLTSATARFNKDDIGLGVTVTGPAPALTPVAGRFRISAVGVVGGTTTATLVANAAVAIPAGANKRVVIGVPTKTAPATGDVVGTLAIGLTVNPIVSPTSPPCAAGKVSGFHIPWQWRNPAAGTVATVAAPLGSGYYLTDNNTTHVDGHSLPNGTSIAQLVFTTASTSFAGYIKQNGTIAGAGATQTLTTTDYVFRIEFAPIAVGVCPGTPISETLSFIGISAKIAQNPTFTGGGGGGVRALGPIPEGKSVEYTGAEGVNVVAGVDPTDANTCQINSPNQIGFPTGC